MESMSDNQSLTLAIDLGLKFDWAVQIHIKVNLGGDSSFQVSGTLQN